MKNKLLVGLMLGAMAMSSIAVASPTPLKFAKGSYCTSWSGTAKTTRPQFSAFLLANQGITVNTGYSYRVTGGRYTEDGDGFLTNSKGNYIFTFDVRKGAYFNFEICAS